MKRFIITESEKNNIREMYGLINEQEDIISQYVTDSRLKKILKEIENVLGEKFTKENFENEIKLSGKIKTESSGLLPEVVTIDYGGNAICLIKKTWPNKDFNQPNKWGFKLPYMSGGNIIMKEPWNLYYVGN